MSAKEKPIATISRGSIRLAIWEQKGKFGPFYTISPSRRYRTGEDWHTSSSFSEEDALVLSKAFTDAYDVISQLRNKRLVASEAASA